MGVSLNPDTYAGGGFFEEGFYHVESARFTREAPEGYNVPRTFAKLLLVPEDGGAARDQFWSAADPKDFVPSADGRSLDQVGRKAAIYDNSNYAELMRSYVNAGFDKAKIGDDIGDLFDGAVLYLILQDAPDRGRLAPNPNQRTNAAGQPLTPQIVVVGEIKQLPGVAAPAARGPAARGASTAAGRPARAATAPSPAPAPAAPTNGNVGTEEAQGEVVSFLLETLSEGPLERGVITTKAMQKFGGSPLRAQVIGLLNNKGHLDSLVADGLITIEGTTIGLNG